jgi:hypothetical protein
MLYANMIMLGLIFILSGLFFKLLYEILSPYHERIFLFFKRRGKVELSFIVDFAKGLGPSISAVALVAIFIPIEKVTISTLFVVMFFGIIISRVALLIERLMSDNDR